MNFYWTVEHILPYQRHFNFINAERNVGKTYNTLKYFIKRYLKYKEEFVYIVRTQDEVKNNKIGKATKKVLQNEYPDILTESKNGVLYQVITDNNGKIVEKIVMGYCIALSSAEKIKLESFPNVKWIIFDEYMKEKEGVTRYVNGFKEPDLFLSIYHTIDREEDKVICFLLGNNTSFYNPYHLHKAFNIPKVEKGNIWTSKNVLFENYSPSEEFKEKRKENKFIEMIEGTSYGNYAEKGEYKDDNYNFIGKRTKNAKYIFAIKYLDKYYGIWQDISIGKIFISEKYNEQSKLIFALTLDSHTENTLLTKTSNNVYLKWLAKNFNYCNVLWESMELKAEGEGMLALLIK